MAALRPTREQILDYRRGVGGLDERMPWNTESLRRAAWAGLQDSMPRAALLSIHARLMNTPPGALGDDSLTQVWGPRFSVFVVAEQDAWLFTLGRMPDGGARAGRAVETADRLGDLLGERRMTYGEAGRALGVAPNSLRYATLTGRLRIGWDGARQPTIWMVPAPEVDAADARAELARRYLRVFGPASAEGFGNWAGINSTTATAAFDALADETVPVEMSHGEGLLLASDEQVLRSLPSEPATARLLPSGDAFYLLWGDDRAVPVPDETKRDLLWTSRVWPGAALVRGEVVGIWRRSRATITVEPWRRLAKNEREAIEVEAMTMPLPEADGDISLSWED